MGMINLEPSGVIATVILLVIVVIITIIANKID